MRQRAGTEDADVLSQDDGPGNIGESPSWFTGIRDSLFGADEPTEVVPAHVGIIGLVKER